jgi:CopG family nickel-responsive transcriptional regulator
MNHQKSKSNIHNGGAGHSLYRFGISLDKKLIDRFDRHIHRSNYSNRSEAIRDLIREELVRKQWTASGEVAGALIITYDHHHRELVTTLMDIQHNYGKIIVSTQHIHLDHHNCLEIVAVRGAAKNVQRLAAELKAQKGVKHLSLGMSTTGKGIH